MSKKELAKRYTFFLIGIFTMALGIALSAKARLGTTPISSVPYVLSLGTPLTMGEFTIFINLLFLLLQIILLRKDFKVIQFMQVPAIFVFGFFVDLNMLLLSRIEPSNYLVQWICILLSCMIVALGISIQVMANVIMLAGEGLVKVIAKVTHSEFGKVKVFFDATLTIIAVILSFILFHKLSGVREGTVAATLLVGTISRFYNKKLKAVGDKLFI